MDDAKQRLAELIGRALARRRLQQLDPDPTRGSPVEESTRKERIARAGVKPPATNHRARVSDASPSTSPPGPESTAPPRSADPHG
jgi:hypothetical protein